MQGPYISRLYFDSALACPNKKALHLKNLGMTY